MPATFVMNADGSNQTRLFNWPVALTSLAWSPGGRSIAFAAVGRYGVDGIYVIGDDGSKQMRLTTGPDNQDTDPAWSPDGQTIAFIRVHNRGSSRV
jgi:Tol biopolymer transport system component